MVQLSITSRCAGAETQIKVEGVSTLPVHQASVPTWSVPITTGAFSQLPPEPPRTSGLQAHPITTGQARPTRFAAAAGIATPTVRPASNSLLDE